MVEQIQTALDVDFKGGRHMVGLLFFLFQQGIVQVLQQRHLFRPRVLEVFLVNLMHTPVNDRFFHRLQSLFAAHHQFAQRQNKIRFQRNRVIFLAVIAVDVHGVDELGTGGRNFDDLPVQTFHQGSVLSLRITDDDIIVCGEESVGDFTLGCEGFSAAGRAQNQAVGVFELLAVHHDEVVGESIQAVVECAGPRLEQLLCRKRDKDSGGTGGQCPLRLHMLWARGRLDISPCSCCQSRRTSWQLCFWAMLAA